MASALLVKLLFVHFTADYLLQFDFLAEGKKKYGLRSWHVWTHVALHGIVVHLVLQTWWITLATLITHGAIDAAKISMPDKGYVRRWFFVDQALHLLVVAVIWWIGREAMYPDLPLWFEANLVLITGIVVLTKPGKFMVGVFLSKWTPGMEALNFPFCGPGPIMGMAERLVVLALVLSGWGWYALTAALGKLAGTQVGPFSSSDRESRTFDLVGSLTSLALAGLTAWLVVRYR